MVGAWEMFGNVLFEIPAFKRGSSLGGLKTKG